MKRLSGVLAGLLAVAAFAPARGEVLPVSGVYPAASDEAAALRSIDIAPFGGEDGSDLAYAIEDRLNQAVIEDGPWFVVTIGSGNAEADLRGTAHSEQSFDDYTETREECVKDDKDKCTDEKRKFDVRCTHRTITLITNVRLYAAGGALVWSGQPLPERRDSYCEDQSKPTGRREVVRALVGDAAGTVRFALAPHRASDTIRVNENRKGLAKPLADQFKGAVRLTKTDWPAACREWDAIATGAGDDIPTLFNRALCGEAVGNDAAAEGLYRRLLALAPGNGAARDGLGRIGARARARAQLAAHARR